MRLVTALCLALLGLAASAQQPAESLFVDGIYIDGELLVSVVARDIPIDQVTAALAREAGLTVNGFDASRRQPLVAIELRQRPLDMVLEYVLGSVGLEFERAGTTLSVHAHDGERTALLRRAQVAYARATNSYPNSERAPAARLAQGELAETEGDLSTALNLYQLIPANYPSSGEVAAAYYHSARIGEALGNWRDAVQNYDRLSGLTTPHTFHAEQRLGRARCDIALGDPIGAIYKLKTHDLNQPPANAADRAARSLVRAAAHNALREYAAALVDLDEIDQLNSALVASTQYQRATSIALEGLGLYAPAGRSWLAYAKLTSGFERQTAMEMAIELFLQAGDEVNALFAVRLAEDLFSSEKLGLLKAQVLERLGLDHLQAEAPKTTAERLARAEAAWNNGDVGGAYAELRPLMNTPALLSDAERARAAGLWARCLDQLEGLKSAMTFLRGARPKLSSLENRAQLDLTAASLFEGRELFDEAVDAYGGIYR